MYPLTYRWLDGFQGMFTGFWHQHYLHRRGRIANRDTQVPRVPGTQCIKGDKAEWRILAISAITPE